MHGEAGVVVAVLFLVYALVTGIPLFIFGISLHKCLAYCSPRLRDTPFKKYFIPLVSGGMVAVVGIILHFRVFDPTGPSSGAKISLAVSALTLLISLVLVFAWILLALGDRIKNAKKLSASRQD